MNKKNYYEILGVSKDASFDDIKSIYHKLVKIYHPDVNKDPKANDKILEINEAYEVLSNPESKKEYDLSFYSGKNKTNPKDNTWYKDYLKEKVDSINNEIKELKINSLKRIIILILTILFAALLYYEAKKDLYYSIVIPYFIYYSFVLAYISKPYMNIFLAIIISILLSIVVVLITTIVNMTVLVIIFIIIYIIIPIFISIIKPLSNLSKIGELKREIKFFTS